jgi:predicted TIM-barrel fold metal-dependent hydrolase
MLMIDTETHIFYWARNHYTTGVSMTRHYTWHEHPAELLVAEMDNAGVQKTFLISYDAEDTQWSSVQRGYAMEDFAGGKKYTKRGWKQFPDRFYWFSTIKNPRLYPTAEIVREDLREGAKGIKVFPGFIQQPLTHPGILEAFQACQSSGAGVLISFEVLRPPHTLSLQEYLEQLDKVLGTFPKINFCLLHCGCADPLTSDIDPVYRLMDRWPNLYMSTAFPGAVWDDGTEYPFPTYLKRMEAIGKRIGTGRLMWGTDWPWFDWAYKYEQAVNAILKHAHFFSDTQKEEFMGKAALRFLKEVGGGK